MKNKLEELSKYCCKPANEQEYEFIKTCAKLGGVVMWGDMKYYSGISIWYVKQGDPSRLTCGSNTMLEQIPVTQFCDILLKDESEFEWKPKVGEWCALDWTGGDVDVFMINEALKNRYVTSRYFRNNIKKGFNLSPNIDDKRVTFRQPTPEEIQAAIDTWDDRVRLS